MGLGHIFIYVFLFILPIHSQSVDEIKNSPKKFIWGQGSGITLNEADNNALRFLISQISTHVESNFRTTDLRKFLLS
ncbi:MAG: LPP20 family lipoprotein [Flavobacteriaceae bacterium]|nr:LPP20 family lipoprotein [Flavobacteriaceae bacterium]